MEKIRCKNNFGQWVEIPKEKFFFCPSVYGFVVKNDKVLMLTNKSNGKLWLPGGGVEVGEKIEESLKREIVEETGLSVEIGKMILAKENFFYYQPLDHAFHAFLFFYICKPITEFKKDYKSDDLESKKPRWIKIEEIKKDELSDLEDDIFGILQGLGK